MLNLSCVICAELVSQTDQIYATKCGHMFHYECIRQWLISSKSCPQCRNTCSEDNINRLYFNLADLSDTVDINSLQEKLDNANLMAQVHQIDLRQAEEQVKKLNAAQIKYLKTISELEQKIKKYDSLILSYNTKLESLNKLTSEADSLRNEVKNLRDQMIKMKNVSSILTSTAEDAEKLLKDQSDPTTLVVWVSALKKQCQTGERKITELENVILLVKADLRRATALNKEREKRLSQLESENCSITEKVDQDKAKVQAAEKDLQMAKKQMKNLEEKLRNCQKKYSDVHEQSRESAIQISSLCLEKTQIEEQFEVRRAQLETEFKTRLDRLERECNSKEELITSLNSEKTQIEQQLASCEVRRVQLETTYKTTLDRLEKECNLKEARIATLSWEKSKIEKQFKSSGVTRAQLETNKTALDRLQKECNLKEKRIASLELEKSQMEDEFKVGRAYFESLRSYYNRQDRLHLEQVDQIVEMESEIFGLNLILNNAREENQKLALCVKELKSRFSIGKFGISMLVLGGSLAFFVYHIGVLEEMAALEALRQKSVFSPCMECIHKYIL